MCVDGCVGGVLVLLPLSLPPIEARDRPDFRRALRAAFDRGGDGWGGRIRSPSPRARMRLYRPEINSYRWQESLESGEAVAVHRILVLVAVITVAVTVAVMAPSGTAEEAGSAILRIEDTTYQLLPVSGACFTLTASRNKTIQACDGSPQDEDDRQGTVLISGIPPGTYGVELTTSPTGYQYDSSSSENLEVRAGQRTIIVVTVTPSDEPTNAAALTAQVTDLTRRIKSLEEQVTFLQQTTFTVPHADPSTQLMPGVYLMRPPGPTTLLCDISPMPDFPGSPEFSVQCIQPPATP